MTPPPDAALAVADGAPPQWALPGSLAVRLVLVVVLAVAWSGAVSGWLVARASGQEAVRRMVDQQNDEVEVFARLLSSKIEQSQKVLRTVASGITPAMLDMPSTLEWLLQQGLPAVQFFDSILVARQDGELPVNLHNGRFENSSNLEPTARDALRRTMAEGKPMVAELVTERSSDARILFTMPLHREDGSILGVVAGAIRLQSQGLLPVSMAVPPRADTRLVVFTREGTILSHSDPARVMGQVRSEPGLGRVFAQWLAQDGPVVGRGATQVLPEHIISMAGMPLPQWMVARISDSQAVLAPLQGAQRRAWWLAALAIALTASGVALLVLWLAQPLARLRDRAQAQLAGGARAHAVPGLWPQTGGEVGALVQVFEGLQAQQARAQQRQQAQESQFRAILDSAPVGIAITRGAQLVVVGRQAGQMLGYQPDELTGQPAGRLSAAGLDCAEFNARVQAAFAAHGVFNGDLCLQRKDGSPVWVRAQARAVDTQNPDEGTVWLFEEMTTAHEERRQDAWVHTHDPLTQLDNRQGFEKRLRHLLDGGGGGSDSAPMSLDGQGGMLAGVVLFLDLDHFTVINDVAGHDAGDDVLRHVARLLEAQVRQAGWAARLGGDEFTVVLPGCSSAHGMAVAEQLRAAVQAWEPVYHGRSFTLGVSIGMVVLEPGVHEAASVLHAADMACYDAKRAGRNQVVRREVQRAAPQEAGATPLRRVRAAGFPPWPAP